MRALHIFSDALKIDTTTESVEQIKRAPFRVNNTSDHTNK